MALRAPSVNNIKYGVKLVSTMLVSRWFGKKLNKKLTNSYLEKNLIFLLFLFISSHKKQSTIKKIVKAILRVYVCVHAISDRDSHWFSFDCRHTNKPTTAWHFRCVWMWVSECDCICALCIAIPSQCLYVRQTYSIDSQFYSSSTILFCMHACMLHA